MRGAGSGMRGSAIRDEGFGRLPEANLVNAASLGLEHFNVQAVELEGFGDRGHASHAREHVAADGLEPLRLDLEAEAVAQILEADLRAEDVRPVALFHHRLALDVVLVA